MTGLPGAAARRANAAHRRDRNRNESERDIRAPLPQAVRNGDVRGKFEKGPGARIHHYVPRACGTRVVISTCELSVWPERRDRKKSRRRKRRHGGFGGSDRGGDFREGRSA